MLYTIDVSIDCVIWGMTILDEHPEGLSHFTCWWLVRGEKNYQDIGDQAV